MLLLPGLIGLVGAVSFGADDDVLAPPRLDLAIQDDASVIDKPTRQRFGAWFQQLEDQAGIHACILVRRAALPESLDTFIQRALDAWQQDRDRDAECLLIVLALAEKRVEVGFSEGLRGVFPETWLAQTKTEVANKYFRHGQYEAGLTELVIRLLNGLVQTRTNQQDGAIQIQDLPEREAVTAEEPSGFAWWILVLVGILVVLGIVQARRRRRRSYATWADNEGFGASFPADGFGEDPGGRGDGTGKHASQDSAW